MEPEEIRLQQAVNELGMATASGLGSARPRRGTSYPVATLFVGILLVVAGNLAASEPPHPLEPLDTSSPRATLQGFLETWDDVGRLWRDEYRHNPSRKTHGRGSQYGAKIVSALDLSELPEASRREEGFSAATYLYDVLCRIELPPEEAIPHPTTDGQAVTDSQWTIPRTEITIARVAEGPHAGQFRFTAETVDRAHEYYLRTQGLPYRRDAPVQDWPSLRQLYGGWMFPPAMIDSLPWQLKVTVLGKAVWGWLVAVMYLITCVAVSRLIFRVAYGGPRYPSPMYYYRRLLAPACLIVIAKATQYFFDQQLNFTGSPAKLFDSLADAATYLAIAASIWYLVFGIAETIIAAPRISEESLDAHLLRMAARTLGIASFVTCVVYGASRVGVPVLGLITGAGIFGLAIALAAQDTLKAFLGSVTIFLDQSYKVGQRIRVREHDGVVESIGMRSTKIRLMDGHLTTIPNEVMAGSDIENIGRRPHIRRRFSVTIPYDTPPEKIGRAIDILREILSVPAKMCDGTLHPNEAINHASHPPRVYFNNLNADSLNLLVFYWYHPPDYWRYLEHASWINTQIMQRFNAEQIAFALPSQTLHLTKADSSPSSAQPSDAKPAGRVTKRGIANVHNPHIDANDTSFGIPASSAYPAKQDS